ncbi:hypothetical protein P3875_00080 [Myroides sp. JBRI-B21084]|uniref:hypothetical protein n=1 Tax=Myroides sp. JBRI-B21084 TaxID=3119977 RepID=UPI0026E1F901|nr:hypothetical protein [Paenimyroides cloacae]WKW46513.1 hypothetical protein P3875_00080 [Paenimyroides cloacae]
MTIEAFFNSKDYKPKEKTIIIGNWLLSESLLIDELIGFAENNKDSIKATCMEAAEFATKQNPEIATKDLFDFACVSLTEKVPRLKWESAKVIGNIAFLYPENLTKAIGNLLNNSSHAGTVVRWSVAFALCEILKLQTKHNIELIKKALVICEQEEKNSIKKIYSSCFKKMGI